MKLVKNVEKLLAEIPIPKDYLKDKNFSYRFYFNFALMSWWNKTSSGYEFYLNYVTYKSLSENFNLSKTLIKKQLDLVSDYRFKEDGLGNRHLYMNTPTRNFIKVDNNIIKKLKDENEMVIRVYIFMQSYRTNKIIGLTHPKILGSIGYNSNSGSNESKLTESIKRLISMNLLRREMCYNGKNNYSIYYKK